MTLVPLIVGICVQVEQPEYRRACAAALTQGASQTGVAQNFETSTKRIEDQAKAVIKDEKTAAVVFSFVGFAYKFAQNEESQIAVKVAKHTTASLRFKQDFLGAGFTYDF